ncbi:MAG TPA: methyltransferase domain-containing protein [Thermodesulfobacteriota bacterium]
MTDMTSGRLLEVIQSTTRRVVSRGPLPPRPAPVNETVETWYGALLAGVGTDADGAAASRYFLKPGYRSRERPVYGPDTDRGVVHQPDVYRVAAISARQTGASSIVDVGCGGAAKLSALASEFQTIGIDLEPTVQACRETYPQLRFEACDLDGPHALPVADEELGRSVIVCADVVEHLARPEFLLTSLRLALRHARVLVMSTPERDLTRGIRDMGPPANPGHTREWSLAEFSSLLEHHGLAPYRIGLTRSDNKTEEMHTIMAVVRP